LDAVLNDVVDIAIAQALCLIGMQIWDAGILIRSNWRRSTTIYTVAGGAACEEVISPLFKRPRIACDRIDFAFFSTWNREIAQRARRSRL
jgi:hypothetical protein